MEEQLNLEVVRFQKEACIALAEDKRVSDRFFIIREGQVRLYKKVQFAEEEKGDVIGPGDLFGVISAMSGHSHVETAVALTDVVLIAVRQEQFCRFIQDKPQMAKNILLTFSKRMRLLNEFLSTITLREETQSDIEHLYNVAEYYTIDKQYKKACYALVKYIKNCPEGKNIQKAKELLKKVSSDVKDIKFDFDTNETLRTYEKDDMIFAEGEPAEEIFIIRKGFVKIAKVTQKGEILLEIIKPGDIFGEMALLEEKPRSASAVAHEKCELMVVNQANFDQLIKTQPQLITRLITLLAERIWICYRKLTNTRIDDPLNRMYDMLLILLEKKQVKLNVTGSHIFDFGTKELLKMIGFSSNESADMLKKMPKSHFVKIVQDKIIIQNVFEFSKHVSFIRRKLEKDKEKEMAI
ncbi:MAG: cyclic nucleotide-binding domain-containing protein [Treponema sp.]|jgi:CRP-like cAMP-binding protein|nr:cyclic nucleotide-binding domain-containing protein [Treponema sp.]